MNFPTPPGESGVDTKNYLKLKDKESMVGIFRGDPFFFRQHWLKGENRSNRCTGIGCEFCDQKQKSTFRFKINFITKDKDNHYISKIFEQSYATYMAMKALHEGDYPLNKTIVRITRVGTGLDTSYTLLPIPKNEVTPELEKVLTTVQLHDLSHVEAEESMPTNPDPNFAYDPNFSQDIPW